MIKRIKVSSAFLKHFVYGNVSFLFEKYNGLFIAKIETDTTAFEYRASALNHLRVGAYAGKIHITFNKRIRIEIEKNGNLMIYADSTSR